MVNRLWPLKWVGFSNNQGYKNVRAAAKVYANVLNKYPLSARTPAVITEINKAKSNLQLKINKYLENIPVAPGAAPAARHGSMPPPGAPRRNIAGALGPLLQPSPVNKQINGARVRANTTTNNYQPANVFLYQEKFFSPHNGRYTEVKRNGMTGANFTKYKAGNINGIYIRQNVNGKPVFTPFTGNNPANVNTKSEFTNFITAAARIRTGNVNAQAKNYLNGRGTNYKNYESVKVNWNKVRKWDKIKNASTSNATTRAPFWAAVTAEMTKRAGAKQAFINWYMDTASGREITNKVREYKAVMKGPNGNAKKILIRPNWNNQRNGTRKNFWNAVTSATA
jgi:hypothetical protein